MLQLKLQTTNRLQTARLVFSIGVLLVVGILYLVFGNEAQAKTVNFQNQTWEVPVTLSSSTEKVTIRNDFDLNKLAQQYLTGKKSLESVALLNAESIVVMDEIETAVNQAPEDAKLLIVENKATEFHPGQNGQGVDVLALANLLRTNSETIDLPVIVSKPQKDLAQTNDLGINELVASGESDFKGSPRNRLHNIKVGADKFNGLVIAEGEEFSFNNYLGEVDGEHGFLPELVIKASGVTPEFGGGLCQVSSTTFRAAMNAGLPITARRNHSFAVQYYAPQGTDATIYPGSQDLKFVNNLASPILIRTRIEGTKLYFDFYGTKDDRQVAFEGPFQYDKKANGSMKATWTRHVTQSGETVTQVFESKYLPPALFYPAPAPETPPATPPIDPANPNPTIPTPTPPPTTT
jgi:vancomycin resistance protein YoaR